MYKKLTTLFLAAASMVIFLPSESFASTTGNKTAPATEYSASNSAAPQIRIRVGNQRRNRRWNRSRRWNSNRRWNNSRRTRVVRQVYYRNGRRYVRTVRVRY
ncbi:MAG TPA: hypothetical protein VIL74_14200 [Pyrinomonadaceae bacterium]|jgi:hypothetical protein